MPLRAEDTIRAPHNIFHFKISYAKLPFPVPKQKSPKPNNSLDFGESFSKGGINLD